MLSKRTILVSVTTKGNAHPRSIFPNPAEKTLPIQLNAAKEVPSLLTLTDAAIDDTMNTQTVGKKI